MSMNQAMEGRRLHLAAMKEVVSLVDDAGAMIGELSDLATSQPQEFGDVVFHLYAAKTALEAHQARHHTLH